MGRTYAGVLGYLAMMLTLVRGILSGSSLDGTLMTAIGVLAIFAVIGWVLGRIAESTVDNAVRERMEAELAQQEQ